MRQLLRRRARIHRGTSRSYEDGPPVWVAEVAWEGGTTVGGGADRVGGQRRRSIPRPPGGIPPTASREFSSSRCSRSMVVAIGVQLPGDRAGSPDCCCSPAKALVVVLTVFRRVPLAWSIAALRARVLTTLAMMGPPLVGPRASARRWSHDVAHVYALFGGVWPARWSWSARSRSAAASD